MRKIGLIVALSMVVLAIGVIAIMSPQNYSQRTSNTSSTLISTSIISREAAVNPEVIFGQPPSNQSTLELIPANTSAWTQFNITKNCYVQNVEIELVYNSSNYASTIWLAFYLNNTLMNNTSYQINSPPTLTQSETGAGSITQTLAVPLLVQTNITASTKASILFLSTSPIQTFVLPSGNTHETSSANIPTRIPTNYQNFSFVLNVFATDSAGPGAT